MSWKETTLGELVKGFGGLIQTGPFGAQLKQSEYTEEGVPVIMPTDISDGRVKVDRIARVPEATASRLARHRIKPDTIVFPRRGEITKRAYITEEQSGWVCGTGCLKIEAPENVIFPKFLYYQMGTTDSVDWLQKNAVGATMLNLSGEILARYPVKFPDLPTQQRIAGILSAYDDLIENNRRRIGLLEQAARLLYREWFVHLRFPGHETAKIVDGLPEGWSRCVVEDLLVLQRGFDLPVGDRKEGDVPVYGSTGIVGFHNEPKVPAPAIITGRSGSLGQVAISDTPCWPLNTALWVKELKGIPATLGYFLLVGLELEKYNGGASVPTLDRKVVHRLPAVRPSSDVADQFDAIASKSFQTIAKLRTYNLQLTRARDLLLPRLMDGRLPV